MKSIRNVLGLVALSAGVSLLYFGISTGNFRFTLAGIICMAWGIWASFDRLVCPRCGKRAWTSGKGITHCQACGTSYAGDEESSSLD